MSRVIDDTSIISFLIAEQCKINKIISEAKFESEYTAYFEGRYDMCQKIIDMLHNNRVNQRPHVGDKI